MAHLATYCIVIITMMIFFSSSSSSSSSSCHMAMAMSYKNTVLHRRHGPSGPHRSRSTAEDCHDNSPGPIGTPSIPSIPRFSSTTPPVPGQNAIRAIEAEIRVRPDIVAWNATGPERVAALADHDAMRIGDLNTKINNAIVVREAGNKSAFAGGASFVVNAGLGLFLMEISLGTPSLKLPMIMDTGSQLVWTQCAPCTSCVAQKAAMFTPSASSSYRTIPCSNSFCQSLSGKCAATATTECIYTYSYASQATTQGTLGTDLLTFSDATNVGASSGADIAFGCGYSNQGDYGGAAGLVGMGQSSLSLPSQLGSSIGGSKFSYCLLPQPSTASTRLVIGGPADQSSSSGAMSFTPMIANPYIVASLYYINVLGFSVAGQRLSLPAGIFDINQQGAGGMIIDSGTTYTYIPKDAFAVIKQAFDSAIRLSPYTSHPVFPACYASASGASVPPLILHLQGVDIGVPAPNYFVSVDGQGTFCLAMIPTNSGGLQIVGNMLHQNFEVLYDLENSRIGFRPQGC